MSSVWHHHDGPRSFPRAIFTVSLSVALFGCGNKDEGPVTAERSQFQVADDNAVDGGSGGPPADINQGTASSGESGSVPSPPTTPPINANGTPNAYTVPDGEEELLNFLSQLQSRRPQGNTQPEMMADYALIQKARIDAADKLWELSQDSEARVAAAQSKLDAMRVLSQMGAPGVDKQLNGYCRTLQASDDPDIAILGRICQFGLAVDSFSQGESNEAQPILDELKKLVAEGGENPGVFMVASQAAMVFQSTQNREAASAAYRAIGDAYKNSSETELATQAKIMLERARLVSSDFEDQLQAMMTGAEGSGAEVLATLKTLLAGDTPGAFMLDAASQATQLMEMSRNYEQANESLALIEAAYKDSADASLAEQAANRVDFGRRRVGLIGKPFVVEGTLPDGSAFDWNSYKDKVVLVDFWATWCGPCLQELPNIRRNYEKYHDQGFEVVGVNLDDDPETVRRFLDIQPVPWSTVLSPDPAARGFEHPLAVQCGVDAIPFIVLVGRDGNVQELHVRGQRLEEKLAAMFAPPATPDTDPATPPKADPAATPETKPAAAPEPEPAAAPSELNVPNPDAAVPPVEDQSLRGVVPDASNDAVYFVSFEQPANEESDDDEAAQISDLVENPYMPREGLSSAELVDFIFKMQDKPQSIQSRPGFSDALIAAADRILHDKSSKKQHLIAAETKFDILHRQACLGDESADQALMQFVVQMRDNPNEKIAAAVSFFEVERRAIDVDELPLDEVPALLDELKAFFTAADGKLDAKHLRLASSTVHAVNRLEDEAQRENRFQEFGKLFATSPDKELARYGKKLGKGPPIAASDLIGKPLDLTGVTADGTEFQWKSYRGKVVLVDFWATWCGPCRKATPQVKALQTKLADRGFAVVAVSLDQDMGALAKYIEENSIPWENLVGEDARDFAAKCGVRGIPTMMVVDPNGDVTAVGHQVEPLIATIEKLLDETATAPSAE